jgi:hypothetical protein
MQVGHALQELMGAAELFCNVTDLRKVGVVRGLRAFGAFRRAHRTATEALEKLLDGDQSISPANGCDALIGDFDLLQEQLQAVRAKLQLADEVSLDAFARLDASIMRARSFVAQPQGAHRPRHRIGDPDYPSSDLFVALLQGLVRGVGGTLSLDKNATGKGAHPYGTLPRFLEVVAPFTPPWIDIPRPPEKLSTLVRIRRQAKAHRARAQVLGGSLS